VSFEMMRELSRITKAKAPEYLAKIAKGAMESNLYS
jgi:hypothetical protein